MFRVRTNDPANRKFNLRVTGNVEKVVDIHPKRISVVGEPGKTVTEMITITPSDKYPFSILSMEQLPNSGITAKLKGPAKDNRSWQIEISAKSLQAVELHDN